MPLTPKRQRFVEEYCVDFNGTQAAIRAGYAKNAANEQAAEMLAIPSVREAVDALRAKQAEQLSERSVITKEWVVAQAKHTYEFALTLEQPAAAKANLELIARLHGFIIERKDLRLIKSISDLTDDELAAIAAGAERDKAVGTRH